MDAWGAGLLADPSLFGPMVLVALPDGLGSQESCQLTYRHAEALQNTLYHDFKIEVRSLLLSPSPSPSTLLPSLSGILHWLIMPVLFCSAKCGLYCLWSISSLSLCSPGAGEGNTGQTVCEVVSSHLQHVPGLRPASCRREQDQDKQIIKMKSTKVKTLGAYDSTTN